MTRSQDNLVIQTPEGCRFSLPLAGPFTRFLAWLMDVLVISGISIGMTKFTSLLLIFSPDLAAAVQMLVLFIVWFGYGIALEWAWGGRTIGKRILRLQVIDEDTLRLTFPQVLVRNLLRIVDMMPFFYLVGGISCVLSSKLQRLGDMVAGTVVIRTPRVVLPNLAKARENKFNSFRQYPHMAARLRQKTTGAEAHLAMTSLLRRDKLDAQARVDLFSGIARHFENIVEFPKEATEGLSDEQYVRNVVEILFTSDRAKRSARPAD
jgi:uncharacterized RDD family membrane protein YckC